MRHSSRWFRPVLSTCLALCIFLFSVATSSAHGVSAPFKYVDHVHNFGLHGSPKPTVSMPMEASKTAGMPRAPMAPVKN